MDSDKVFLCHQCGKIFCKLSTLESHTRLKHMEKPNEFMCDQCGRTFQKKYNLIKHLESGVHDVLESVKCAKCDFRAVNRKLMGEHYQNFHQVSLKETNVYFNSADEFYLWKSEFENKTRSRFVKMSSSRRRKNGFMRSTFFCHRDGNFVPKGRNLRHIKLKGSNKINAHCPAKMEVDIGEKIVIASYIDTHLGHELDVTRIRLAQEDRALIAKKLSMQVPFEEILNEINRSENNNEQKHVKFITRKDLWNIVDTFKINPKTVVYGKSRLKMKKKIERPKKEPKWKRGHFKVLDSKNSKPVSTGKKRVSKTKRNEKYVDEAVSVGLEDGETLVFCPVIFKDGNEHIQKYALIGDKNEVDTSSCLIINSKGEFQSLGHQVIYTDRGEIEVCENVEEDSENESLTINDSDIFADKVSTNNDITESPILNENRGASQCKISLFEQNLSEEETFQIKPSKLFANSKAKQNVNSNTYSLQCTNKNNAEFIIENHFFNFSSSHKTMNSRDKSIELSEDNSEKEDCSGIMHHYVEYINRHGSPPNVEEIQLEDQPKYEETVGDLDEIGEEYVMMSPTKGELDYAVTPYDTEHSFKSDPCTMIPFESVTVETIKEETPEEPLVKEEITTNDNMFFQVCDTEYEWNKKRTVVLNQFLNVHSMINNEQQLKVISNNISYLENVIPSLSNKDEPITNRSEVQNRKMRQEKKPNVYR